MQKVGTEHTEAGPNGFADCIPVLPSVFTVQWPFWGKSVFASCREEQAGVERSTKFVSCAQPTT